MSAATQNEMERLRETNEELNAWLEDARNAVTQYKIEINAALEREAALAAHVERLREDVYDQANTILGEFGVRETIDDYLPESYNESAFTSLTRRDLIKQAEAYKAGWDASGEGWNAEYPGDAHLTAQWEDDREEWIRQRASEL